MFLCLAPRVTELNSFLLVLLEQFLHIDQVRYHLQGLGAILQVGLF